MAGEYLTNPKYPEKLRYWQDKYLMWHLISEGDNPPNWVIEQRAKLVTIQNIPDCIVTKGER